MRMNHAVAESSRDDAHDTHDCVQLSHDNAKVYPVQEYRDAGRADFTKRLL